MLRAIFERIEKDRPELPLEMKVAHATFAKCIMFGTKKASSYELVYRRPFPVDGHSRSLPKGLLEAYTRSVARRKLNLALNARNRKLASFNPNEYLYFYRENLGGYVGPAKVTEVSDRGNMKVLYRNKYYSVSRDMAKKIQQPLNFWIEDQNVLEETESGDTEGGRMQQRETAESATDLRLRLRNYRPGDCRPEISLTNDAHDASQRSTKTGIEPNSEAPYTRTRSRTTESTKFDSLSYASDLKVFYANDNMATKEELSEAFAKELQSWKDQKVYEAIPISSIPRGSNIVSSHVVYRWKDRNTPRERLKARIVPHGNRDRDREHLRSDSPSMKPEVLRVLCSYAVDMGFDLRAIDIKTAFLRTGQLDREVFVRPPPEATDRQNYWKLLKPAYGLVDGPIRWYHHSRRSLLSFGLTPSNVDPTLYFLKEDKDESRSLIVASQVDDY